MLSIKDCSKFLEKDFEAININPLAPKWPFRACVIGPSGCGKTNMICDLLLNYLHFDKIYLYAKDLQEPFYVFLIKFFTAVRDDIRKKIEDYPDVIQFGSEIEDVIDVNDLDKTKQNLIIFDDFVNESDTRRIKELFIRSRKKNTSILYLTQSYFETPKIIRLNSQYFCLFNIPDKKELRSISDSHSTRIDFKTFMDLYQEICKDPYQFMVIDKITQQLPLHIRKNWDGLLIDS